MGSALRRAEGRWSGGGRQRGSSKPARDEYTVPAPGAGCCTRVCSNLAGTVCPSQADKPSRAPRRREGVQRRGGRLAGGRPGAGVVGFIVGSGETDHGGRQGRGGE